MQASKVSISQETRAKLDSPILTSRKRRQLRERLVVDAIRGTRGHVLSKQQLIAAAGLNPNSKTMDYHNGLTLIGSMIKRGVISHNETASYYKKWTIIGDTKKKKAQQPVVTPAPKDVAESVMPKAVVVALKDYEQVDRVKLVDMAKEFAWRENSDSLREFIAYVENAIK